MTVLIVLAAFGRGLLGGYLFTGGCFALWRLPGLYRTIHRERVWLSHGLHVIRLPWWWPVAVTVRTIALWPLIVVARGQS